MRRTPPGSHRLMRTLFLAVFVVAVAAAAGFLDEYAAADHKPADKTAAAGSTIEVMEATTANGSFSETHTLLSAEVRTSSPTDLVLQFTGECSIFTEVTTVGNDESEAVATVNVWIEVDGERVPVSSDAGPGETGKVVLCNRDHRVETMQFENENATIKRFLETRQANAFNWIALDVGSAVHKVTVEAQLEGHAESRSQGNAQAKALVGKRTLVVDAVKLPNDATR